MKDIEGFEGKYAITKNGRVWSYPKQWMSGNVCKHEGKFLKTYFLNRGYEAIVLLKDNKREHFLIHRLVARAFIINPNKLPQVNHKDGVKTNNTMNNLEWCTNLENRKHAIKIGTSDSWGWRKRRLAA